MATEFIPILQSKVLENKVWGKKSKPRNEDPSMKELLSWKDDDEQIWNYQCNNKELLKADELSRYMKKINKSEVWKSEAHDCYRKFIYNPSKKEPLIQEPDESMKKKVLRPQSADNHINKERKLITVEEKRADPTEIYFDELDKNYTSDYLDRYSMKMIQNTNQLREELEKNASAIEGTKKIKSINGKKLICKKVQTRKIEYDAKGQIKGSPEDYFEDVWIEVDQINEDENEIDASDYESRSNSAEKSLVSQKKKVSIEEDEHVDRIDFSNVKSRLLSKSAKKAKKLDPQIEIEKLQRRKDRIKKFGQQTKWLPNSAFTTYYGKPAFENYGRSNTNPTNGGFLYGNYLKTHNINPHRGPKEIEYKQSYNSAIMYGSRLPAFEPEVPRKVFEDFRLSQEQVEVLKNRNPLFPDKNEASPRKRSESNKRNELKIKKPDLTNSLRFASEENSPTKIPSSKSNVLGPQGLDDLKKMQKNIRNQISKHRTPEKDEKVHEARNKKEEHPAKKEEKGVLVKVKNLLKIDEPRKLPQKDQILPKEKKKEIGPQSPQKSEVQPNLSAKILKKSKKNKKNEEKENEKIYPEHESKMKKKFIQTMREKKEISQKIALKVTEVYPIRPKTPEKHIENVNVELLDKLTNFDDKNLPEGYITTLSYKELNPKYYKHVPAVWLKRIPSAGVREKKNEDIKECFNFDSSF